MSRRVGNRVKWFELSDLPALRKAAHRFIFVSRLFLPCIYVLDKGFGASSDGGEAGQKLGQSKHLATVCEELRRI